MQTGTWSFNPKDWTLGSRRSTRWMQRNFVPRTVMGRSMVPRNPMRSLRSRSSVDTSMALAGLGLFAVGAMVGAGLGLMLAPKSGQQLRQDMGRRLPSRMPRLPGVNREPDVEMSPEYGTQTSPPGMR